MGERDGADRLSFEQQAAAKLCLVTVVKWEGAQRLSTFPAVIIAARRSRALSPFQKEGGS